MSLPALLIKISTCFHLFLIKSVTFSRSVLLEISTEITEIFLWFNADKGSVFLEIANTLCPLLANILASSKPIPRLVPVITTFFI